MENQPYFVGVKALLTNEEGKILTIKFNPRYEADADPRWDLPGGRTQPGESIREALIREVEEETGIVTAPETVEYEMDMSEVNIPVGDAKYGLVLCVCACGRIKTSEITLSHEHVGFEWLTLEEATPRLARVFSAKLIDFIAAHV